MKLDRQIQALVDEAPQDGKTPQVVQAIASVLEQLARRVQHPQYYVLQTLDQDWVITTLRHRTQPNLEKAVIYAFPRWEDAAASAEARQDPQLMAQPIPIIQLLFQTMTLLKAVDSIVFLDIPGNLAAGTEISCQEAQALIQLQLRQVVAEDPLPPNIA